MTSLRLSGTDSPLMCPEVVVELLPWRVEVAFLTRLLGSESCILEGLVSAMIDWRREEVIIVWRDLGSQGYLLVNYPISCFATGFPHSQS